MKKEDFKIMSDMKTIEGLKADLLCVISEFFKILTKGTNAAQDAILNCISGAIILLYILGGRLGYSHIEIDETMKKKLKLGIIEQDDIEKEGKDLTKLYRHLKERI
ncbi:MULTISPECIES: MazG-like family protein [Clostridium]|uniref:MazG-like family protein n=1 Tax=Clostridium TaxID=1485 RepID=UPI000824815F|nr:MULTISPECIES: MazG-like family protein [Clostridium]PJI08377.1 MazG-like family protein [Clostridium sp. CT7]